MKSSKVSLGVALLFLAALLGMLSLRQWPRDHLVQPNADRMALNDLLARGAGGNARVAITDFVACSEYLTVAGKDGQWEKVWMPVVPKGDKPAPPSVIQTRTHAVARPPGRGTATLQRRDTGVARPDKVPMLVLSTRLRTHSEIEKFLKQSQIEGVLLNRLIILDDEEQALLQEAFPGLKLNSVLVLHEDWSPASRTAAYLLIAGAAVTALAGLLFLTMGLWPARTVRKRVDPNRAVQDWMADVRTFQPGQSGDEKNK